MTNGVTKVTASLMRIAAAASLAMSVTCVTCVTACGGDDDGGNPDDCALVAGGWDVSGGCGQDFCVITQVGCTTSFDCTSASSYSGSVSGNHVSYQGETATGEMGTCSGTVSGDTMSGTCTVLGVTCSWNAGRQ